MQVTRNLQKWGNSSAIRLPKEVVVRAKLSINQPLAISVKGNTIILTPVELPDDSINMPKKSSQKSSETLAQLRKHMTSLIPTGLPPLTDVDTYYQANRE